MGYFLRRKKSKDKSKDLSSSQSLLPSRRRRLSKKDDTYSSKSGLFSKRKEETSSLRSGFFYKKQREDTRSLPSQFVAAPSHKRWADIEPQYDETPPPSPLFTEASTPSPLHVTVMASQKSREAGGGHSLSGTTISDLSGSLVTKPTLEDEEDLSLLEVTGPESPLSEGSQPVSPYSARVTTLEHDSTLTEGERTLGLCSQDAASDIVNNIFGLVGAGCKRPEEKKPKFQGDEWGTAPSASVDEGEPSIKTPPVKNKGVEKVEMEKVEKIVSATPIERTPSDQHEDYEVVLDEEALEQQRWFGRSAKSWAGETVAVSEAAIDAKADRSVTSDMDQEERYRAVFGEDPDVDKKKQKKMGGIIKNASKRLIPKSPPRKERKRAKPPTTAPSSKTTEPVKEQNVSSESESNDVVKPEERNANVDDDDESGKYLQLTIDNLNEEELLGEILFDDEEESKKRFPSLPRSSSKKRELQQVETLPKINEEVEEAFSNGGATELKTVRSRSWGLSGRPINPVKMDRSLSDDSKAKKLTRTLSQPLKKISASFKRTPSSEPVKPEWKEATDPESGQTYYYHRVTRKTSWSKPRCHDKQVRDYQRALRAKNEAGGFGNLDSFKNSRLSRSADLSGVRQKQLDDGLPPLASGKRSLTSALRKKSSGDLNGGTRGTEQEVARLLKIVTPKDAAKVAELMQKHEGNDEALLVSLRALAESHPFDEPLVMKEEENDYSAQSVQRTMTTLSGVSGVSRARSTRTAISTLTDTTQKVKNTKRTEEDKKETPPDEPTPSSSQYRPTRERALRVEEFPSSEYDRKRAEVYESKTPPRHRDMTTLDNDDETNSVGNDTDGYGTDSVSELGHSDTEFQRQRKRYDLARRMALDDAIRNKDWELAVSLTENIRGRSFDSRTSSFSCHEWTQSELERLISENDWDAVAAYVAYMRDSQEGKEDGMRGYDIPHMHERGSPSKAKRNTAPNAESSPVLQKRFGAKSQLQHHDDTGLASISSSFDESVYTSEESSLYTSTESSSVDVSFEHWRRMATWANK